MNRIYQVCAEPGQVGKDLKTALELSEKTGVLTVPQEAICLTIAGGLVEEIDA